MNLKQYIEQIAQGQYEPFREYLNAGENGRPVTSLNLCFALRKMPNQTAFLEHLFEALKPIDKLTKLDLFNNNIGPDSAAAIADALKTNANLTELGLTNNDIGSDGAAAIAAARLT